VAWSRCCDTRRRKGEQQENTNFDLNRRASLRPYRENLCSDAKGEIASGSNREDQSTDAEHRDGAVSSRDEGPIMGLDRRDCVVQPRPQAN
jgi:hypothetical protein